MSRSRFKFTNNTPTLPHHHSHSHFQQIIHEHQNYHTLIKQQLSELQKMDDPEVQFRVQPFPFDLEAEQQQLKEKEKEKIKVKEIVEQRGKRAISQAMYKEADEEQYLSREIDREVSVKLQKLIRKMHLKQLFRLFYLVKNLQTKKKAAKYFYYQRSLKMNFESLKDYRKIGQKQEALVRQLLSKNILKRWREQTTIYKQKQIKSAELFISTKQFNQRSIKKFYSKLQKRKQLLQKTQNVQALINTNSLLCFINKLKANKNWANFLTNFDNFVDLCFKRRGIFNLVNNTKTITEQKQRSQSVLLFKKKLEQAKFVSKLKQFSLQKTFEKSLQKSIVLVQKKRAVTQFLNIFKNEIEQHIEVQQQKPIDQIYQQKKDNIQHTQHKQSQQIQNQQPKDQQIKYRFEQVHNKENNQVAQKYQNNSGVFYEPRVDELINEENDSQYDIKDVQKIQELILKNSVSSFIHRLKQNSFHNLSTKNIENFANQYYNKRKILFFSIVRINVSLRSKVQTVLATKKKKLEIQFLNKLNQNKKQSTKLLHLKNSIDLSLKQKGMRNFVKNLSVQVEQKLKVQNLQVFQEKTVCFNFFLKLKRNRLQKIETKQIEKFADYKNKKKAICDFLKIVKAKINMRVNNSPKKQNEDAKGIEAYLDGSYGSQLFSSRIKFTSQQEKNIENNSMTPKQQNQKQKHYQQQQESEQSQYFTYEEYRRSLQNVDNPHQNDYQQSNQNQSDLKNQDHQNYYNQTSIQNFDNQQEQNEDEQKQDDHSNSNSNSIQNEKDQNVSNQQQLENNTSLQHQIQQFSEPEKQQQQSSVSEDDETNYEYFQNRYHRKLKQNSFKNWRIHLLQQNQQKQKNYQTTKKIFEAIKMFTRHKSLVRKYLNEYDQDQKNWHYYPQDAQQHQEFLRIAEQY